MKTRTFGLVSLLAACFLAVAGCGKNQTPVENPDENAEIANPASVYCEENGGTLQLEDGTGLCMFPDGSYCEEWSFKNGECQPGEIIYNTISEDITNEDIVTEYGIPEPSVVGSELYSEEDLSTAEAAIMNVVNNEWKVKVESFKVAYAGDEKSNYELDYCKSLNPEVMDCAVFTSNFHVPNVSQEMAGAFEPDTDMIGWNWYLGRADAGEWEVLTNGFG